MKNKILIFTPLVFYSQEDESLFFAWINQIRCIKSYKGIGTALEVTLRSSGVSFNDL